MTGDIITHLADHLTQDEFIKHLQQILARFPDKEIILFTDNFPTHKTPCVIAILKAHPRLKFIFIPKYSPKLNIIEALWKELKTVVGDWFYPTIPELEHAIIKFFRTLWHNKQKAISLSGFNKKYSI